MEKRTLIALALSFAVLGFYPVVLQKFFPDYYKSSKKAPVTQTSSPTKTEASPISLPASSSLSSDSFVPENDILWENEALKLRLNKKGAAIRQISFPKYVDSDTHAPLNLFSLE